MSRLTCRVVISRAAFSSADATCDRSLVVAPVTCTTVTRAIPESRTHIQPPPRSTASAMTAANPRRKAWRRDTSEGASTRWRVPLRNFGAPERVYVPRAEREQQVAVAQLAAQEALGVLELGQPGDASAVRAVGRRGGD